MKIVINALHMHLGETGGAETYLLELLRALDSMQNRQYYSILIWPESEEEIKSLAKPNIDYHIVTNSFAARLRRFALRCLTKPHPVAWLANMDADVVHYPNAVIRIRPFRISSPLVLTMTDIQHLYYPEHWPEEDIRFREKHFPESVERADRIIAISEFTRQGLIEKFNAPPEKVRTIHLGVDHELLSSEPPNEDWMALKGKYQLPGKFLIYPAGTWPHKNHLRLVEAVADQVRKGNKDLHVILTGIRQFNHERILQRISDLGLEKNIPHLGHLPWSEVVMLYQKARGMIYPSLFEGFGLPLVEAMAAGCPVACSNRAAIPEIAAEAAHYFNPEEVEEISDAIERLWFDEELRIDLIERGRIRARGFNWESCARQTIEVYESVAAN
jgi:glycosyltransferase involved in cell wall biosynthesis